MNPRSKVHLQQPCITAPLCVLRLMASKAKAKIFHAVAMSRSFTISGGFAPNKHFVPETRDFTFTHGDGAAGAGAATRRECVRVGHREGWLCELTTGSAVYHRPLARVRILRELSELVALSGEPQDSQMAALAFDDEEADCVETPTKAPRPRRVRKQKATAVAVADICKRVEVRERPDPGSRRVHVHVALDKQRRLWVHVDDLPWLVNYIREEKESGGLDPVDEAQPEHTAPRIYWNFRDCNWIARAQAVNGQWLQTTRGVKGKQKRTGLDFPEAKQAAYFELEEWLASVTSGEIVAEEPTQEADVEVTIA